MMSVEGRFCPWLAVILAGLVSPGVADARALLLLGSADELGQITAPELAVESRTFLEAAAQLEESAYPEFNRNRKPAGMILLDGSTAQVRPIRLQPDDNIGIGYTVRGGWAQNVTSTRFTHGHNPPVDPALDGDVETWMTFHVGGFVFWPGIDLGGVFPVNRIVFYTHPERAFHYLDVFTVWANDGDPEKTARSGVLAGAGMPAWEEISERTENTESKVVIEFPLRPLRYVSIQPHHLPEYDSGKTHRKYAEIAEIEIHGEGYVPRASYISEIVDISQAAADVPGERASWGKLYWSGWRDQEAQVIIRTRTGGFDDEEAVPDPSAYSCFTGRGDQLVHRNAEGRQLTLSEYKDRSCDSGPIAYDTENWSFWSAPYDFHAGAAGTAIASPGPARYIQVRIDFLSTVTDGAGLRAIGFDFSRPPSASRAVAEVFPREVPAAVDTAFTYLVLPTLVDGDRGFDSLQIETLVRPTAVRSVRVGSETVCAPCLPHPDTTEILEDGLIVHFDPLRGRAASKTPVEVVFEAQVVRYGTEFRSWIFSRDEDEVRQLVEGGDAANLYRGGGLAVAIPFSGQLIAGVEATPRVFTPNGDGTNDRTRLSFALLNLSDASEVDLVLYDLSGRMVRRLARGQLTSDRYDEFIWDGLDNAEELVPPGHYVYEISVQTDGGDERRNGVVSVAY